MKIGLDIHGVIDTNPILFSKLSKKVIEDGGEVHIITGTMLNPFKIENLKRLDIRWTHLFSISDYHKALGTPMTFSDKDNPWIDNNLWDRTKAEYCKENSINFHIDDTNRYGEYFSTPFGLYDHINKRMDWHFGICKQGAFKVTDYISVYSSICNILRGLKNV